MLVVWLTVIKVGTVPAADDLMTQMGIVRATQKIPAPGFKAEDINGNLVQLSDFRGKMVLLFFWATW